MRKTKNSLIKNIFIMWSYAYPSLSLEKYSDIDIDSFDDPYDLLGQILCIGMNRQIKEGLYREYIPNKAVLSTIRGKINIADTITTRIKSPTSISCTYDDFSTDNLFNEIIKTTRMLLLNGERIKESRQDLIRINWYLTNISELDLKTVSWSKFDYHRHNSRYRTLLEICHIILDSLILTTKSGKYRLGDFTSKESIELIFQKFLLNYYIKHRPELHPSAPQIPWNTESHSEYLPRMHSDLVLRKDDETIIIEAKFCKKILKTKAYYGIGKTTYNSNHLYQLFTYVSNYDTKHSGTVSGILLYVQTVDEITLDDTFTIGLSPITIKTIDLNQDFNKIKSFLDNLV